MAASRTIIGRRVRRRSRQYISPLTLLCPLQLAGDAVNVRTCWRVTGEKVVRLDRQIIVVGNGLFAAGLANFLRSRGHQASALDAGPDCYDILAARPPDALIIDLLAARQDDFALLRRLRHNPILAVVPVLVSSPGTVVGDINRLERRLRALGAHPLLNPHDLDAILSELVDHTSHVA